MYRKIIPTLGNIGYHLKHNEHIFHLIPWKVMYAHWFGRNVVSKMMAPNAKNNGIGPFLSDTSISL